jgi:hypothetical protein
MGCGRSLVIGKNPKKGIVHGENSYQETQEGVHLFAVPSERHYGWTEGRRPAA